MSLQTQSTTLTDPAEIFAEIDGAAGLTPEAKAHLQARAAEGATLEQKTIFAEVGAVSIDKGREFVIAYCDNLLTFARVGITATELEVASYVLRKMEFGNLVCLSQTACAHDLGKSKQSINRSFKGLEKKGFFVKDGEHLFVNSTLFAKGLSHRLDPEKREHLFAAQDTKNGQFQNTLKRKK